MCVYIVCLSLLLSCGFVVLFLFCCVFICFFVVPPVLTNRLRLRNTKNQQQHTNKKQQQTKQQHKQHLGGAIVGEGAIFGEVCIDVFAMCLNVFPFFGVLCVLVLLCCVLFVFFVVSPALAHHPCLCNTKNNHKRTQNNNTQINTNKQHRDVLCWGGCYFGGGRCVLICSFSVCQLLLCCCSLCCVVLLCVLRLLNCVPCPRYSPSPLQYKNTQQPNKKTTTTNNTTTTYWGAVSGGGCYFLGRGVLMCSCWFV